MIPHNDCVRMEWNGREWGGPMEWNGMEWISRKNKLLFTVKVVWLKINPQVGLHLGINSNISHHIVSGRLC